MTDYHALARDHAEWSQATFGTDTERGPTGPLNHLAKEVSEILAAPTDEMEYADAFLLILDAARRAGISADRLLFVAGEKLSVNKARKWRAPNPDGSVEHIR